ncbi:hypothetical protein FGRMN_912 [Fusarium graminum]|nr:hypothetical protein FGRMN_912 [Fusarium graminum]
MSTTREPGEGCLAVLSSCFKSRGKAQSEDLQHSRPANHVASLVATQKPAPTPPSAVHPDSQPAESEKPPSAIIDDEPSSCASQVDQVSPKETTETKLDLWQEAYSTAEDETKKWISDNLENWSANAKAIQELVDLVSNSEEKYDQKAWKIERGDRAIVLRDYTNKVSSCLIAIGDIAINFAPAPSPVIWSAVKVLLKANISQLEDRASIMGCTDMVLCLVRRGAIYEEVYLGDCPLAEAQKLLEEKLVSVYKTCLDFLASVHKELKQGNLRRFLDALLDPGHGEQLVSDVKKLEQDLENTARSCEALANLARSKEHRDLLKSLQLPLKRIDNGVTAVLSKLNEAEKIAVMEYISTIRVGIHHHEKCKSRTEGTCDWLVSHPKFREWEDSSCSSVFWLQGMGTGKSYLSSKVIDRYLVREDSREKLTSQHDEGFGFFYCYRSDPSRQITVSILRSYIRQLSEVPRRIHSIHKASWELYNKSKNIQHDLTLADCQDTLATIINSYPRVTLVLDALDECRDETKRELVELFQNLVQKNKGLLKVFVASRKDPDIESYLEPLQNHRSLVSISTSDNAGDIEKFITSKIREWQFIPDTTKQRVRKTLVEKSDGMFRWAYLQLRYLKKLRMNSDILARLERLPETLSEAYDEIYNECEFGSSQRIMLQRAIRWVLWAKRPLDSVTLLAAIRTESKRVDGDKAVDASDVTEPILESICHDLVVRDSELGIWKFPHASVAEHFLLKHEPWIVNSKSEITISLISLLIDCCAAFPTVWPPPEVKKSWEISLSSTYAVLDWFNSGAAMGLSRLLPGWWDLNLEPSKLNAGGKDLLAIAAQFGNISLCEDLVGRKVDINRNVKNWRQSALGRAIHNQHIDITRILLNGGANPNLAMKNKSLLCLAAQRGPEYLQAMLDAGADPNLHCGNGCFWGCALSMAASEGYSNSVESLIEAGADVNPTFTDRRLNSPLAHAFSGWGNPESKEPPSWYDCVRLLLRHGADAKAPLTARWRKEYKSMLEAAVSEHSTDLARLLVEYGADIKTPLKCQGYDTILEYSVENGDIDFARFLVKHGADVNGRMKFGKYGSILAAATLAPESSLDMVKFLVEEAAANPEQLSWEPPPVMVDLSESDSDDMGYGPVPDAMMLEKSRAKRTRYLLDERQVDSRILDDLRRNHGL